MKNLPRLTPQTVSVLCALLAAPDEARYGRDLGRQVGLTSGTLQPILARLEQAGVLEHHWEESGSYEDQGRARRRYYRLTAEGAERTRLALADITRKQEAKRILAGGGG